MSEPHTADERARIVAALSSLRPDPAATDRARAAIIGVAATPGGRGPLRWIRPTLRFALPATGIAAIGTVLVLSLPRGDEDRAAVAPGPQTESCVVQRGQTIRILPLQAAVAMRDGTATVAWNAFDRTIRVGDAVPAAPFASTRLSGPDVFGWTGPAFAQNERGDGLAAWIEGGRVVAAHRAAGGDWSDPEVLGPAKQGRRLFDGPAAAVAPDGTATVAWPSGAGLRAARRAPDGTWSRAATPGTPLQDQEDPSGASEAAIAVDDDGDVAAVWMMGGEGIGAATWPANGTGWTATQKVLNTVTGPVAMYGNPRVVASGRGFVLSMLVGRATRIRSGRILGRDDMVVATRLPSGASRWSRALRLSPRGEVPAQNTGVAGSDGEVAVAWIAAAAPGTPEYRRPGFPPRILRVALTRDGRFPTGLDRTAPATLLVPGARGTISSPALALGDDGDLTVAWTDGANQNSGRNSSVRVITYAPGAGWSGGRRISERGTGPLTPALTRDEAGNTAAAWMRCAGGRDLILRVATRPAGAAWGAATRVR
ncbi:MAG: hypothetical protein IT200_10665 [Thermoleophilia bacterium]|nr:hypothetical protein [Thermoleophilia bacterium]